MLSEQTPFALKLGAFVALSGDELSAMDRLQSRRKKFAAGREIVHQGQFKQTSYILNSGWVCSYKLLSGGARQIVDFQIPGDFLGLRSMLFRSADHNIEPVTSVDVSEVRADDLMETFHTSPRLATGLLWAASRDEAMMVEHLVGIGRRNAKERVAHFLLELSARLKLVRLSTPLGYACPLTQNMLADAMGLTAIHINRVLRELREDGLATFQHGKVVIHDFDGLVALADFDKSYLDHEGPLLK
jgi:CRP-like cAMP-binding protein